MGVVIMIKGTKWDFKEKAKQNDSNYMYDLYKKYTIGIGLFCSRA